MEASSLHAAVYAAPLDDHVAVALDCIISVVREFGLKHLAFSFNGGKDCTVLLHLLRVALQQIDEENKSTHAPADSGKDVTIASTPAAQDVAPPQGGPTQHAQDEKTSSALRELTVIYFPNGRGKHLEFDEVNDFIIEMADAYGMSIHRVVGGFKEGLTRLLKDKPIKAIFMGQRRIDPHAGQLDRRSWSTSGQGWPKFLRINPIIDWSYNQVWEFLRTHHLPYCCLYDQGYTSLGSRDDTEPNPLLRKADGSGYNPAYMLKDGSQERAGRTFRKQQTGAHAVQKQGTSAAGKLNGSANGHNGKSNGVLTGKVV